MKKKLIFLLTCMIVIFLVSLAITSSIVGEEDNEDFKIVTSFYPIYVIANNIVGDVEGVEVVNLTDIQTGCLHDYQLTTDNMKRMENADIFVMNGGGMEGFLNDIVDAYPNVLNIDSSEGISLLFNSGHNHDEDDHHGEEDHHHDNHDQEGHDHENNGHIWLNMDNYIRQIENITEKLSKHDPSNQAIYEKNSKEYIEDIKDLQGEYRTRLEKYKHIPIVMFHDSFAYLADELNLNLIHIVNVDENTSLSAGQVREVIDNINEHSVKVLLTEVQYSDSIATTIAEETGASVYLIDSIVSGTNHKEAYIKGMKQNLEILEQAYIENWDYNE